MEIRKLISILLVAILPYSPAFGWGFGIGDGMSLGAVAAVLAKAVAQLQQINNMIKGAKSLSNPSGVIGYQDWIKKDLEINVAKVSPAMWNDLKNTMDEIVVTVNEGQKIAQAFSKIDQRYQDIVKGEYSVEVDGLGRIKNFSEQYDKWSTTTKDSIASALYAVGETNAMFATEAENMRKLTDLSKNASGNLQALQVGHLIAKSNVEQLQKLRTLVQAQVKSQAVMFANEQNEEDLKQKMHEQYFHTNRTTVIGNGEKL